MRYFQLMLYHVIKIIVSVNITFFRAKHTIKDIATVHDTIEVCVYTRPFSYCIR